MARPYLPVCCLHPPATVSFNGSWLTTALFFPRELLSADRELFHLEDHTPLGWGW